MTRLERQAEFAKRMTADAALDDLRLSVRAENLCRNAGAETVGAILKLGEQGLRTAGAGSKTVTEIRDVLRLGGLRLPPGRKRKSQLPPRRVVRLLEIQLRNLRIGTKRAEELLERLRKGHGLR